MRAVLDTNVLVSAVLSRGSPPDLILQAWRRGSFQLVTSAPLLFELDAVLRRPRIKDRLGWTDRELTAFVVALSSCHMLTFLAVASNKGFVVDSYADEATGHLEKNAEGKRDTSPVI